MTGAGVAFLGYDASQTRLIGALEQRGHAVAQIDGPVTDLGAFEHVVSFGYRHILREPVLKTARLPIVNLHISLLPFNRGAHPNFWAWVEGTPQGVSLHEIDPGLDTGPILAQRPVAFADDRITLRQSQAQLIEAIEALFLEVLPDWLAGALSPTAQVGTGSLHKARDLPEWVDWDMEAREVRARYDGTV